VTARTRTLRLVALAVVLAPVLVIAASDSLRFELGGGLIDLGFRLQDPIEPAAPHSPAAIWDEVREHNELAAEVRQLFPRTVHHPSVAMVVCMDARIDTDEIVGDTRRYYYVLRLAGSIMSEREEEMLELAVENGVEVILLTTHTECAAEHVAADATLRARYPAIAAGVDERARRRAEFLARPAIAARIADGTLRIEQARIDTRTGRLTAVDP
jgi:carbonic anhydrase